MMDKLANKSVENRSSFGKYKRLKMPSSNSDIYNTDDISKQHTFLNEDIMTDNEFKTIKDNFKKLREEIMPSHQKNYSKKPPQNSTLQPPYKHEITEKLKYKNDKLRTMIANNKGGEESNYDDGNFK